MPRLSVPTTIFSMSATLFDIPQTTDHVFGFGHFDDPAADILVGHLDVALDPGQGQIIGGQLIGIHHHLILLDEAADTGDFGDAGDGAKLVAICQS